MNERYKLNQLNLNEIIDTEGYYADPSTYYSFECDKNRIVELLNKKEKEIREQELKIKALKYALKQIKGIDVEIVKNSRC